MTDRTLPRPQGWKLLVRVPEMPETYSGSMLVRPDPIRNEEAHATTVLEVMAMGPQAYTGEKFTYGQPWCRVGDFVLVRTYSGTRFLVDGKEFRLINDDQVEAVVSDPRGVTRVGG